MLGEHLEHADLDGPPGAAAGQHQGGDRPRRPFVLLVAVVDSSASPAARLGPNQLDLATDARWKMNRTTRTKSTTTATMNSVKTTANAVSAASMVITGKATGGSAGGTSGSLV